MFVVKNGQDMTMCVIRLEPKQIRHMHRLVYLNRVDAVNAAIVNRHVGRSVLEYCNSHFVY